MNRQEEDELYAELLKKSPLKAAMFLFLTIHHRGKKNAIPAPEFLEKYGFKDKISLRDFRDFRAKEIAAGYVVKGKNKGIFWPTDPSDLNLAMNDLHKKALAILARWKRLERAHPDLYKKEQLTFREMEFIERREIR